MELPILGVTLGVLASAAGFLGFTTIFRVESSSMMKALQVGDRILVARRWLRTREIVTGDVIVVQVHHSQHATIVKRVVAVGGETVRWDACKLFVGERRVRDLARANGPRSATPLEVVVPDGALFVMGDSDAVSRDSRDYGPVRANDVVGIVKAVVWPLRRAQRVRQATLESARYR